MFGKMIYYDAKAIKEYASIASGKNKAVPEKYSQEKGIDAQIEAPLVAVGVKNNTVTDYHTTNSLLLECSQFEKLLDGRDDYMDFTMSDQFDITTANRGSIIRFDGFIEIPEQFDLIQIIDRFSPVLNVSIDAAKIDAQSKEIVRAIFDGNNAFTIPMETDLDGQILCAKARKDNLLIPYEELEELAEESVTILAKLSSVIVQADKYYYDPLKDFMHLNRAMRKRAPERIEGMQKLYVDGEYRNIELLAIYV